MGVEIDTTGRASKNRIGACTRGPASRADSTVRVVGGGGGGGGGYFLVLSWLVRLVYF